jgi:hypothetical protein
MTSNQPVPIGQMSGKMSGQIKLNRTERVPPCRLLLLKHRPVRNSLAPLTRLFNLLITAIVERLGPTLDERVTRNRELQSELNQFDV